MNSKHTENLSIAWCKVILQALSTTGARFAFLSPGYRDAPFVAALRLFPKITAVSCMDERSAAYQALGCSKISGKPSLLICTSGTAVANYLPAVLEAKAENIPLVVISCDRPWELTFSGANQTLDQSHILGNAVKEYLGLPSPEDKILPKALYHVVKDHAEKALLYPQGTLHLNVPLRNPLEPIQQNHPRLADFQDFVPPALLSDQNLGLSLSPKQESIDLLEDLIESAERGILILGRLENDQERDQAKSFAERLSWPIYCDVTSSLKGCFDSLLDPELPFVVEWLKSYRPDTIIHVGRRTVSKYWDLFLENQPQIRYAILSTSSDRQDPSFTSNIQIKSGDFNYLDKIKASLPVKLRGISLHQSQSEMTSIIEEEQLSLPYIAAFFANHMKSENVFLGNSSAIRAFDTWCPKGHKGRVEVNRGVSGIEGLLSTVIGLTLASDQPWNLVIGDVSFIHDLNAVYQLSILKLPVRIFIINNSGGQIFKKLPIGRFEDILNPMLTTPHSFDFQGLASSAKVPYSVVRDKFDLLALDLKTCDRPEIIEVKIDPENDLRVFDTIKSISLGGE